MNLHRNPKFKVGDKVKVNHPHLPAWTGRVTRVKEQDDTFEYWTTNAPILYNSFPCLAWEQEMEIVE